MNYTRKNIVALLEAYFIYKSYKYCFQQFQIKFPEVPVPDLQTVYDSVCHFHEVGMLKTDQEAAARQL